MDLMTFQYKISWSLVAVVVFLSCDDRRRVLCAPEVEVNQIYVDSQVPEPNSHFIGKKEVNNGTPNKHLYTKQSKENSHCYQSSQSSDSSCEHLPSDMTTEGKTDKKESVENVQSNLNDDRSRDRSGLPSSMLQTGIDGIVDQVDGLVDQVLQSKIKAMRELEYIMEQVSSSRARVMEELDSMMGRVSDSVSESRLQVLGSFDALKEKVAESRRAVVRSLDEVMDTVARGQLQEELQALLDQVAHSQVMQDIQALPEGIRNSLLSVRNRSYVVSGIAMAVTAAILMMGVAYCYCCTNDSWSWAYHLQPLHLADLQDNSEQEGERHSEITELLHNNKPSTDHSTPTQDKYDENISLNNNSESAISKQKTKKLGIARCSKQHLGSHSYIEDRYDRSGGESELSPEGHNNARPETDSGFLEQLPSFSDHCEEKGTPNHEHVEDGDDRFDGLQDEGGEDASTLLPT